jgi:UDP-N-acetylglucosamine 2-epimerase (non-hydrolysing)
MVRVLAKMKIAVVIGTRPEIIRLYHTVKALPEATIYWTGQNFEKNLSDDIFNDPWLSGAYNKIIRLSTKGAQNFFNQFGLMINSLSSQLQKNMPDKVLILGDTNSSLAGALVAKKLGLPLYHMEAGNRCCDPNSPEEVNRKLIDSIADVHMCYTQHAKQNLLDEGVAQNRIHVIGNPIAEFKQLHEKAPNKEYILVTFHRKENEKYLTKITAALLEYSDLGYKVIACLHPRYFEQMKNLPFEVIPSVSFSEFVKLQREAEVVITDSGTVCEEAAMLKVPSVIIRKTMERPELFEYGCTILSGVEDTELIWEAILEQRISTRDWDTPPEYRYKKISNIVRNILISKSNYI